MKYIAWILFFFMTGLTVQSQVIYHFEYKFPLKNDSVVYDAFFVKYSGGNGFVRVSCLVPGNNEVQLVNMKIQELFYTNPSGIIDTNKLMYKTSAPEFLSNGNKDNFPSPVFFFQKKDGELYFNPSGISIAEDTSESGKGIFLKDAMLTSNDLNKKFVAKFFMPEEDFYTNLFLSIGSRGRLTEEEKKIKLYLLIVANTNDATIGPSCNRDMNRMLETFREFAENTGITMTEQTTKTIYGTTYNLRNIKKAIKDLSPSKDDIVIFYYSGHGFRKEPAKNGRPIPYQNSRFPFLDFRANSTEDYNVQSLNLEEINKLITAKEARFSLVLSDCCNNLPESSNAKGTPVPATRGPALDWSDDNFRALFLNPVRMTVMATAAKPGQLATGANSFGGFFSYFFKTSLETHFSVFKRNVTWDKVINEAAELTATRVEQDYCNEPHIEGNRCRQNPFFDLRSGTIQ